MVKSVSVVRKSTECERLRTESFRYCEWGKRYEGPRSVLGRRYLGSTASVTGVPSMLMNSACNSSSAYYYMNNERVILNLIPNEAATRLCLEYAAQNQADNGPNDRGRGGYASGISINDYPLGGISALTV